MKIVSLLPSSTEIVYALGLGEQLVAVTHECDYPPEAQYKPIITSSVIEHEEGTSMKIHDEITALVKDKKSIYHLNEDLLRKLNPDLILTQELCDVCAVSYNIVVKAARVLEGEIEIISLEPNFFDDILSNIRLVGEKTGREKRANELFAEYKERINYIVTKISQITGRPNVYCMEWLDPPFAAGHWIPEMVAMAGGKEVMGLFGEESEQIEWENVLRASPDIIILMPCGFNLQRTIAELKQLQNYPDWSTLPAVQNDQVYAVDGSSFFNRPGPRIIDGLEIMAQIIHPDFFTYQFSDKVFQRIA